MATYYVSPKGSDAAAGTSYGAAWLTLAKLLGAAGMASGDTAYIAPGVYREVVTVNMTSAVAETKVYGDVDGSHTDGIGGEVRWTAYLTGDAAAPSATTLLTLNGRDFITFQDIVFIGGSTNTTIVASATSTDITFRRCLIVQGFTGVQATLSVTNAQNIAANWTIDSCTFIKGTATCINFLPATSTVSDYDMNVVIKNCLFIGGVGISILGGASGANSFKGGGVLIQNCTNFGGSGAFAQTNSANWSTTFPMKVYNSWTYSGSASQLSANAAGQIIEDYNILLSGATPRTNVTAGAHSISDGSYAPLFFTGHEFYSVGSNLMPFGMPKPGSPLLGFGNQASSPTTDILGAARPSGFVKIATGTATAGAAATLTDSGKTFGTNALAGTTIKIISGTGSGQTKSIRSNTATVITVDGNWKTNPSTDSVYEIYLRATSSTGTATAGTTTTLTDSGAAWGVNMWAGYTLTIDTGTGNGQTLLVVSNTATVLTFATATAPDNTSTYSLFRGASINVINAGVGCYEYGQSAIQNTESKITGVNSWQIPGVGYYDFRLPVNAVPTNIYIKAQYDSQYSGTLPSLNIINGGQVGVADATATCVAAANTTETLTLAFTPTSAGRIIVRIKSSNTAPTGNAYFDSFAVN